MKLIKCKDYNEVSAAAANITAAQIKEKPGSVLGLPTGSTPLGMYKKLIEMNKSGEIDFSPVITFNLDEYYPISADNDQSYYYFMHKNFFDHININTQNIHILNGEADDPERECGDYEAMIENAGGIDLQVLGIGQNGHIGFNEPDDFLISATHKTHLTESTVKANSRFFSSIDEVPIYALTMGVGSILKAKKIIILISGKEKAEALKQLLSGKITTKNPSTMLNMHRDVTVIADEEALELIK
jgi:glucosamine-6-phosphate deaminase